jgi:flavin reductase (DIM6/NTAB) family NADH-FMN oxidoreductase RutF
MTIRFQPENVESSTNYRTIVGSIVPRPIGWISTVDAAGVDNVAPYSFFGIACVDPPMLQFAQGKHADGSLKDTGKNIRDTEEFVHNLVTEQTLESMHQSSVTMPRDESEFDACEIERSPSHIVSPPRVADAVASFECSLHRTLELGSHTLIIGRIECIHIDESATTDGKIDIDKFDPVGRITAGRYLSVESQIMMDSVKDEDFPKTTSDT